MSDDAPQPHTDFFESTSRSFAKFTNFIDNNIRIIQYGVYCAGGAGLLMMLHSVRAFTKFGRIQDIPKEFIGKHVRLHGRVKWIGTTPPAKDITTTPRPIPSLPLPPLPYEAKLTSPSINSTSVTMSDKTDIEKTENIQTAENTDGISLSKDNRGIYEGAGELHPWENNIDPDVTRIQYEEDFHSLYLQVDHTPVISLLQKQSNTLLPLQLADVEVTREGVDMTKKWLMEQRVWFTLISHEVEDDILMAHIRPAKVFQRRSINEELVGKGLAMTAPMDLNLYADKAYTSRYQRLLHAQEKAEKHQVGIWKTPKDHKSILAKIWIKIRNLVGRRK